MDRAQPRTGADNDRVAALARALGHPARVQIVELLASQSTCRGADVFGELPLAQSTVSEHLRVLREAGIVDSSPEGPAMLYCLDRSALAEVADFIGRVAGAGCCSSGPGARSSASCEESCNG